MASGLFLFACQPIQIAETAINISAEQSVLTRADAAGITSGDFEVNTVPDLKAALQQATAGEVVYLKAGVNLKITADQLLVPEGVTLAGNRDTEANEPGPQLRFSKIPARTAVIRLSANSRITGIRLRGPDDSFPQIDYDRRPKSNVSAIQTIGPKVEVDNCEISNFHWAGVQCFPGSKNIYIHHNYFHDIHAYPVLVGDQTDRPIRIEHNRIEWIWHAVAGSGYPGSGYTVAYNEIVRMPAPKSWMPYTGGGHAIDMHTYLPIEQARNHRVAGEYLHIHNNVFRAEAPEDPSVSEAEDVFIRGVPQWKARIHGNQFYHEAPETAVRHWGGNVWVYDNQYGAEGKRLINVLQSVPQIVFQHPPGPQTDIPLLVGPTLGLNVSIDAVGSRTIDSVEVWLDEVLVHQSTVIPKKGAVILRPRPLNGKKDFHELTVYAWDEWGSRAYQTTAFRIHQYVGEKDADPGQNKER